MAPLCKKVLTLVVELVLGETNRTHTHTAKDDNCIQNMRIQVREGSSVLGHLLPIDFGSSERRGCAQKSLHGATLAHRARKISDDRVQRSQSPETNRE